MREIAKLSSLAAEVDSGGRAHYAVCKFRGCRRRGLLVRWRCWPHSTEEAMTMEDYLLHLFYLIDTELEALKAGEGRSRLRARGPEPKLHDSEVVTMELAGEFLGIDTDEGIWAHFRRYHLKEFPALGQVCRTTFARQAANLWGGEELFPAAGPH